MKRLVNFFVFLLVLTLFSFVFARTVRAQTCRGGTYYQGTIVYGMACVGGIFDGKSCKVSIDCPGGSCLPGGAQCKYYNVGVACSSMTNKVSCEDLNSCGNTECCLKGGCVWDPGVSSTPAPTVVGATPGPRPNTCSGDCFGGIANCGAVGRTGGGGTCPTVGDLCCAAPNQPRACNFGLTPNPAVVSVGQTVAITPTGIRITGGGVVGAFAYATRVISAGAVSFNPTQKNVNCFTNSQGRFVCRAPASGWGTNMTGVRASNGTLTNGLAVTCNVIDHGSTTRYFDLQVNPAPTPTPAPGWWQAVNGDVLAGGDIVSKVPTGTYKFIDVSALLGGYPGIAQYATDYDFTADTTGRGTPSTLGWLVASNLFGRNYDSGFFAGYHSTSIVYNNLSGTVDGTTFNSGGNVSPDGYFWYKAAGDLTINGPVTIGATRKVVLLVQGGNLTINGNVVVSVPGQGFFMAAVGRDATTGAGGSLNIAGTVTILNGIFLSDGATSTGVGTVQLALLGALKTNGGLRLERNLGALNATTPAEQFTYDPRFIMLLPKSFGVQRIVWKEIAP